VNSEFDKIGDTASEARRVKNRIGELPGGVEFHIHQSRALGFGLGFQAFAQTEQEASISGAPE
jgi:hypothetical protein